MISLIFVINFATINTTTECCPQFAEGPIPSGTNTEMINYAISGQSCIAAINEAKINERIKQAIKDINEIYRIAEANCETEKIGETVNILVHQAADDILVIARASCSSKLHLVNKVWYKIKDKHEQDSSELDVVDGMHRVHRIAKLRLNDVYINALQNTPLIIEVVQKTCCKIEALLRDCKILSKRSQLSKSIEKLKVDYAQQIIDNGLNAIKRGLLLEGKVIIALKDVLNIIKENSEII